MQLDTKNSIISEIISLRRLINDGKFEECHGRVDADLEINDSVPDLWYVKSMVEMTNSNIHNYCILKARSLRKEGYDLVVFTDKELSDSVFKVNGMEIFNPDKKSS
ncbi:MAG: hypothetical protein WCQ23_04985 [Candidatus Methanomethylophilaceae archaeon]